MKAIRKDIQLIEAALIVDQSHIKDMIDQYCTEILKHIEAWFGERSFELILPTKYQLPHIHFFIGVDMGVVWDLSDLKIFEQDLKAKFDKINLVFITNSETMFNLAFSIFLDFNKK